MSKPITEDDLSNQINDDRIWRIREISDLSTAVQRADDISQKVLLRALVAICYAHWEGYVKFATQKYIDHIALKRLCFSSLNPQFTRNHFLPRLAALSSSKTSITEKCNLVDEIVESSAMRFSRINPNLLNTGNLNFEAFSNICLICGVSPGSFSDMAGFVDQMLLKRRNAIAHGENMFIDIADREDIVAKTIELMRRFGDAIENHVFTGSFRR